EDAAAKIEYEAEATGSKRIKVGETKMLGQRFGDSVLLVTTCSPHSCDDIRFGVGMNAMAEARINGAEETMLVDAHNCCAPESAGEMTAGLFEEKTDEIRLGVAHTETEWDIEDGMGPLGVRVGVIEVEGQKTAYITVDGNNMVPILRNEILKEIEPLIDGAEVMTTDTHVVNRVESHNMIGENIDHGELKGLIAELVEEAIDDLEPVEAGMGSEKARITVFGNDRIERLASTTSAVAAVGGALAVMITVVAILLSVIVFLP
ncbi:MAG: DUF2070 family protein, partial [Halobacteria archaeon]|nr:DUF2070 family protein [Halobacteria archaeon]